MATEGRAKGLAGVSHSLLLQVVASLRALFDRSAPWLTLVSLGFRALGAGRRLEDLGIRV